MIKWLKKYFIPHDDNGHKPHFLRGKTAVIAVSAILAAETFFLAETLLIAPDSKFTGAVLPAVIAELTNRNRTENGLEELKMSESLAEAAKLKAEDMVTKGYFAHVSPEGVPPWHWIDSIGYEYVRAGENLAVNFVDSQDVVDAWMSSASHKANIMKSSFSEIGVATAAGRYKGRNAIFIVELFAEPYKPLAADPSEIPELLPEGSEPVLAAEENPEKAVLGAYNDRSPIISSIASAPRRSMNIVYIVFGTIVLLAILLAVFIKRNIQHPSLIVNGAIILMVISAVMAVNKLLLVAGGNIS